MDTFEAFLLVTRCNLFLIFLVASVVATFFLVQVPKAREARKRLEAEMKALHGSKDE